MKKSSTAKKPSTTKKSANAKVEEVPALETDAQDEAAVTAVETGAQDEAVVTAIETDIQEEVAVTTAVITEETLDEVIQPVKRKRGRPRKQPV